MSPHKSFPTVAAALGLFAALGCADSPSAPSMAGPPAYAPPAPLITLMGVVRANAPYESEIVLETNDGDEIRLAGDEAARLESVDGAEVEVHGTWGAAATFSVADFLVRAVDGSAALDGVLTEMYADDLETEFVGYGLRLTRGGLLLPLIDPPTGLLEFLGERVWVTGPPGGPATAYGLIGKVPE